MTETTFETVEPSTNARDAPPLTLTILVHPDLRRLGQQCPLEGRGPFLVSRKHARFHHPGGPDLPLADRHVSRKPVRVAASAAGAVVSSESGKARLDGRALDLVGVTVDAAALARGVVLTLSGRVTLLLRRARPAPAMIELGLVGPSPELQRLRARIRLLAPGTHPILIHGATGTGKELVARALHAESERAERPWVALNLAAIPASTAASQLFGHTRGAFTGARSSSAGLFGAAATGSLFLDELGEAPDDLQPLLLRALESGEVQVVGGGVRHVDVRVLAATDADLERAIREGRLRPALYHRLAGATITIPPLRQRREDIAAQLRHFVLDKLRALGREALVDGEWLAPDTQAAFIFHDWPGNTRQLKRVAEGMVIEDVGRERARVPEALTRPPPEPRASAPTPAPTPAPARRRQGEELDARALARALEAHDYRLMPTAKSLGLSINTLKALMHQHGYRRAQELTRADIERAREQLGGEAPELNELARALQVSPHGLRLRLRELA